MNFDKKGFSLMEVIVYISVFSLIITSVFFLTSAIFKETKRRMAISEVNKQGIFITQALSRYIRNSEDINSPAIGSFDNSLSLDFLGQVVQLSLNNGRLGVVEGVDSLEYLSNSKVVISDLDFFNSSDLDTPGLINFSFKISVEDGESIYERIFNSSASLR